MQKPGIYYVLTEKGRPKAVVLSYEEYDSLLENLEILGDPKALAKIKKAEEEFEKGAYVPLEVLKKEVNYSVKKEWVIQERAKKSNRYSVKSNKK